MEETICEVEWDAVRVSPFQPRRTFSEEELEELAASIRTVGLIHPPVVRPVVTSSGKVLYYELIAGERRWRAIQKAGFRTLKVIIRTSNDAQAAQSTLIENVQRVNLDPIELADAFKKLIEVFRMSQEEVAEKVGKKRSTVANYLRLLTLPEKIKHSISSGEISMGHAKAILSLGSPIEQLHLSEHILANKMNVREAERESRKLQNGQKRASTKRDIHVEELEEKLQRSLGTQVQIDHTKKGGRITLHYCSMDDLERLLGCLVPIEDRKAASIND
jgi:ParB family transcriptional regulator, chromosome partitioning protein